MRSHILRPIVLVALAVLLAGAPAVAGPSDGDGGKAYAREQLVREARRVARPDAVVATDLDALRTALAEDVKLRASWRAASEEDGKLLRAWDETIAARRLLLGDPASTDRDGKPVPPTDGALADGRSLLRWMLGDAPDRSGCGVTILAADRPGDDGLGFSFPVMPPAPEAAPAAGKEAPPPVVPPAPAAPPAKDAPAAPGGPSGPNGPAPAPVPSAPEVPTLEAWARAVRTAAGGNLLGKVIEPAVCGDVSRLMQAAATPTPIRDPSVPGLRRHALETQEPFAYNAAVVALRRLQAAERVEAFRADRPAQGLVPDTVREKVQRAEGFAEQLKALEQQSSDLLARLDAMVTDLDNWKTMAAILSVRIEDRRKELTPAEQPQDPAAPAAPPDLLLRVLSAQETTVALEMRLLYLATVRSDVRLGLLREKNDLSSGLLEQLVQATRDELAAAQAARALYEEELARVRRERRMDKLQSEERQIRGRVEAMGDAQGLTGNEALRMAGYQALLQVNAVVQEAVRRRRALGDWAVAIQAKAPTETSGTDPVAFARDPRAAAWDATTLQRWRELLPRAAFDAALVAEHYAVADQRLKRLRETLRAAVNGAALRERLQTAVQAAERALEPLARRGDWALRTYRLSELLDAWRRDFDDAMSGMEQEKERIAERQAGIRRYQEELLGLGTRSFAIRVVSDLDAEDLTEAANDTLEALGGARDWILVAEPEQNAWQFVRERWMGVVILLGTIVVLIAGLPRARRGIERWLAKRAMRIPNLRWADASVSRERQDARARKEQAQRKAAEIRRTVEAETAGAAPTAPAGPPPGAAPAEPPTAAGTAAAPGDAAAKSAGAGS